MFYQLYLSGQKTISEMVEASARCNAPLPDVEKDMAILPVYTEHPSNRPFLVTGR